MNTTIAGDRPDYSEMSHNKLVELLKERDATILERNQQVAVLAAKLGGFQNIVKAGEALVLGDNSDKPYLKASVCGRILVGKIPV